jgi:heme O synthase-like polyprenyltransferase
VSDWYRKRLAKFATPLNLLIVAAFLFVFSLLFLNLFVAKFLFFLLLITVMYYAVYYLRIRKEKKKREIDTGTQV